MTALPAWLLGQPQTWYLSTLTEFFGPSTPRAASDDPAEVPPPLRDVHELLGPRRGWVYRQNVLLPLDRLRRIGERTVFYEENQRVTAWACGMGDDDPTVWMEDFGSRETPPGWLPETERLTGFLLQTLLFELAIGCPFGAVEVEIPNAVTDRLAAAMSPAPVRPWRWPSGGRFFVDSDSVALISPREGMPGFTDVTFGSRRAESVPWLQNILGRPLEDATRDPSASFVRRAAAAERLI